ncbi:hypothetical protein MUK42_22813 [Musa troglodytarum]|uniref:Uncharacterized protein n=1 Tax=Musa troglodytarum TaxID=320322 RepID=A0A9E7GIP5_9LILI|nr:hypothetical protein MUK42_22813 [Musa troglodytarum]
MHRATPLSRRAHVTSTGAAVQRSHPIREVRSEIKMNQTGRASHSTLPAHCQQLSPITATTTQPPPHPPTCPYPPQYRRPTTKHKP